MFMSAILPIQQIIAKNINAKDGIIRIAPISLTGIALGTGCKRGKYRSGIIFAGVIDEFANV